MHLKFMTWPEVDSYLAKRKDIIIPIGATEQHGPMGLIGTDHLCAEGIAAGVAEECESIVAPTVTYGMSLHHLGFSGTVAVRPQTFAAVIEDCVNSLAQHGFERILFVNGHGGNEPATLSAFSDLYRTLDIRCEFVNWWIFPPVAALAEKLFGEKEGHHATPGELSVSFFLHPEHQKKAELKEGIGMDHRIYSAKDFRKRYPDGRMISDSSLASVEAGKQLYETAVAEISNFHRKFIAED